MHGTINIKYLVLIASQLIIPSHIVKSSTSTSNWETAQRLICHYELFSQIVL